MNTTSNHFSARLLKHKYLASMLAIPIILLLNFKAFALPDFNFSTSVEYPELEKGTVFAPTFSHSHKLLFYTGTKDSKNVSGYFRSKHFLGWSKYDFPPFENYNDVNEKGLIDVSSGPNNTTVALGYIDGVGQVLASSSDGKNWGSALLEAGYNFFNTLVYTDANAMERVIAYGSRRAEFLSSSDSKLWSVWAFPSSCESKHHCFFDNKYFNSIANGYILLQSTTLDNEETNIMYFSSNLTNWYHYAVPFEKDYIKKAFRGKNNVLMVSVVSSADEKTHKLWVTPDYQNWNSFDLPENAEVLDAKIERNNNIYLLLAYKNSTEMHAICLKTCDDGDDKCQPCPPCEHDKSENDSTDTSDDKEGTYTYTTDLVSLDPETNLSQTLHTFNGLANSMNWFDNKGYISGDFINDTDNKRAALVVMS